MKKQNAAIWCALLLIALPIAVLLLVPSPSARIVDVVQPLMESEEIDYWNPDIFFLTKYGLTAAISVLCGLVLTLLCSRKRLPLDTRAAICTVGGFGALVGARVLYMLARYSYIMVDLGGSSFFWQFWQGGYTLYGGILGGMGPQATQVFYQRILDKTDARRDQEHLPTLIWSDTGMPDRTQAILSGQTEPVYQRLLADARLLERAEEARFRSVLELVGLLDSALAAWE